MAILLLDVVFKRAPLPVENVEVLLAIVLSFLLVLLSGELVGDSGHNDHPQNYLEP